MLKNKKFFGCPSCFLSSQEFYFWGITPKLEIGIL
jgi:hypothetical protein